MLTYKERTPSMSRGKKARIVGFIPENKYFFPANIVGRIVEEVIINIEEIESIRLSDIQGFEQDECAEKMNISRATFQRIINSTRTKIADALVNGKAIKIEGGNFSRSLCVIKCTNCGQEWKNIYVNSEVEEPLCAKCNSSNLSCHSSSDFCRECCKRKRNTNTEQKPQRDSC